jgi:hypothetical protein
MIGGLQQSWRSWAPAALTLAGIALGLWAAIEEASLTRFANRDAAALVNGQPIPREDVDRAFVSLSSDRRTPMTAEDRARVLERLIEDELLAQRAVAMGLASSDPNARKVLVRSLIDSIVLTQEPLNDMALEAFYNANQNLFVSPPMLSVAGAEGPVPGLPSTPMTVDKLKDYLGAGAEALLPLSPGQTAGPFKFAGQSFTLRVSARSGGAPLTFAEARPQVAARAQAERDGRRLRDYLDGLKRRAAIERFE